MASLLDFIHHVLSGHNSTPVGDYGRNPGPVLNPRGLLNGGGVHTQSGPVRTRFGDAAPIVERSLVNIATTGDSKKPGALLGGAVIPTSELLGGFMGGPVTMPFNPPPLDQGTPLPSPDGQFPPMQPISMLGAGGQQMMGPESMQGAGGGLNMPMMMQMMRDPRTPAWLKRVMLQNMQNQVPIDRQGGVLGGPNGPGVRVETYQE